MTTRRMHLPERVSVPEIHDKHPTGDCHCTRPLPSGRVYTAGTGRRWEARALCGRIPRHPWVRVRIRHEMEEAKAAAQRGFLPITQETRGRRLHAQRSEVA